MGGQKNAKMDIKDVVSDEYGWVTLQKRFEPKTTILLNERMTVCWNNNAIEIFGDLQLFQSIAKKHTS